MKNTIKKLLKEEKGQDMVEYVIILAILASAAYFFDDAIKNAIGSFFDNYSDSVSKPRP
ncbi:MAG: Flp family type IVb pilin [Atribacterota bacterium]